MTDFIAKEIFLTKGKGIHREKLTSFELSLRNAGIAACNLVRVSSIFPPHCKLISRKQGLPRLNQGQVVFCVMSETSTNEPNRLIASAIGIAMPRNPTLYGYLSEHHGYGQTEKMAGDYSEDLAAEMLARTLGVDFDPDQSWDEKRELWKISGRIFRTRNVTQSAMGHKDGLWTTVIAAAVFIL
ncbi:MAG: arginine decarboxylase, pyruvoyl-dependent [Acidobacteriota bacterium]|nr:arginine decarboxylase, pyruvoyl-dependent [Acidobacteriota bacterium]